MACKRPLSKLRKKAHCLADKIFTYEEYYTLLNEIEAILNFRPLSPLPSDPTDLSPLTPAHFLTGDSLIQPVQNNFLEVSDNRLSRWQHLQKLRQLLWLRWQREYLQELQKRIQWRSSGPSIKLGAQVLLIEDNVPPLQWPMGLAVQVHPGPDGEIRVATVRTSTSTMKRSIKKLCVFPTPDDDEGGGGTAN